MPAERSPLTTRLEHEVLLLDGGFGTLLMAAGLEAGRAPEWWNLEHPDRITAAHAKYVAAGSDIIHTNSFGGSPLKLHSVGLEGRCREVNLAAARLAREAVGEGETLVAGDLGPSGQFFAPMGAATREELLATYQEQTMALAEGGVDLFSIETMYDRREAEAALQAALETGLPVLTSMTFESRKSGFFTIMGDRLIDSLTALSEAGSTAVGFNCSVTSGEMIEMVRAATAAIAAPIVAQPNAGQPRVTAEGVVYDATPEVFGQHVREMVRLGARVIGGCCGTDPSFIAEARRVLDEERNSDQTPDQ